MSMDKTLQRLREVTQMTNDKPKFKFRYWQGVKYVAPHKPAPASFARCGTCHRAWDDARPSKWTPAPSGRCPFEYWHRATKDDDARASAGFLIDSKTLAARGDYCAALSALVSYYQSVRNKSAPRAELAAHLAQNLARSVDILAQSNAELLAALNEATDYFKGLLAEHGKPFRWGLIAAQSWERAIAHASAISHSKDN